MQDLFARLPAVVYTCGPPPSFATSFVSDNVYAQFGYQPAEFYADPFFWTKQVHDADRDHILDELANIGERQAFTYEYRFRHRNGDYAWLHDQVSVIRDRHQQVAGLVGSWFDITARKRLEAMQLGQAKVLQSLVERRGLEESLEQIIRVIEGQNTSMLCSILRFDPATQSLRHGAAPSLPEEYNRAIDGLRIGPRAGCCGAAAYHRQRIVATDTLNEPRWKDYRTLAEQFNLRACWSQPILSPAGQLLGTFAMYYHKPRGPSEADLRLIEQAANLAALAIDRFQQDETLRQRRRLTSLGTLAAGIAHEINNPLAAITLAVESAWTALDQNRTPHARDMLEGIMKDTQRCANIVRSVLQFTRRGVGEQNRVRLNDVVQSACDITQGYASQRGINIDVLVAETDPVFLGSAIEMQQVVTNLIRNAIEASTKGDRVTVETTPLPDSLRITIRDTGHGMTPQQKARMFDPFFTTREREGGTGLGLSITHGIVTAHGGSIHVDTTPDRGTTVSVCLPDMTTPAPTSQ